MPGLAWPEPYRNVDDPLETITYAAAHTQRSRLETSVLDALVRVAVALARRLATLHQLSGGRVIAGLGQGCVADGLNVVGVAWEMVEPAVHGSRAAGRDPQALKIMLRAKNRFTDAPIADGRPPFSGSVDQIRNDLARAAELGVDGSVAL